MKRTLKLVLVVLLAAGTAPSCSRKDNHAGVATVVSRTHTIQEASSNGDIDEVKRLLHDGVLVGSVDGDKNAATAMHGAARAGHCSVIELLIKEGGDVNARNKYLMTPLHEAAIDGRTRVVQLLISSGAKVDAENHGGWTPLFNAAMDGHAATVKLLLSNGANGAHADKDGNTALHYAAGNGEKESCEVLVAAGASVNVVNKMGETPLTWLRQRARWSPAKHGACAAFLEQHGAK
jgi:ankyrin repeat protein